jgi:hypothetical protein
VLDSYLFKISTLDMRIIKEREATAIKRTIQMTYSVYMLNWMDIDSRAVRRMLEHYQLYYMVEDMEVEENEREILDSV